MRLESSRQCPTQMAGPGVTSALTIAGKANGYTGSRCRWKDSGTDRQVCQRQVWVARPAAKPHGEAPLLTAQCQAALLTQNSHARRAERQWMPKWQYPQRQCPPKSGKMKLCSEINVLKVITQVFPSEVLTEVLSMLRTRLSNGKCPHGGFDT